MKTILCIMLAIVSLRAMGAQQTAIAVRPENTVIGTSCVLAEIANVQADAGAAQRINSVTICSSPLPGKSRKITREQIVIALRRGGIADGTYDLLCPAQVSIMRDQRTVSGQMLFDTAKGFAQSSATWSGTVAIESLRLPMDQPVPVGELELRVRAGCQGIRKGQCSVPVEIVLDGKVYRLVQVSINVRIIAPILIATKAITRGEALTADNTAVEERDITRLPDDALTEAPAADMTASSPFAQGAVIRKQWVCAPPAVKSGDSVLVIVESQGMKVTDKGTAAQDGRPGDRIRVRMGGDAREIRATVSEPGIVTISLGRRSN